MEQPDGGGLDGGDTAGRGGQQLGTQRAQYGNGDYGEPDLADECGDGPADSCPVGTPPPLHRERSDGDQQGAVYDKACGAAAVQQGHQYGDDHRGTADEDTRDRGFGGAFRREDGQVEADHANSGEHGHPAPLSVRQLPQRGRATPAQEGEQEQAGEAVAQSLAARVRVGAEDTVGGEGTAHEDAGEGREERPSRGRPSYQCAVHGNDARQHTGLV